MRVGFRFCVDFFFWFMLLVLMFDAYCFFFIHVYIFLYLFFISVRFFVMLDFCVFVLFFFLVFFALVELYFDYMIWHLWLPNTSLRILFTINLNKELLLSFRYEYINIKKKNVDHFNRYVTRICFETFQLRTLTHNIFVNYIGYSKKSMNLTTFS